MTEPLIEKLDIRPGELLVVRFPAHTHARAVDEWAQDARKILPEGVGCMVLIGDIKLTVVKAAIADDDYEVGDYELP